MRPEDFNAFVEQEVKKNIKKIKPNGKLIKLDETMPSFIGEIALKDGLLNRGLRENGYVGVTARYELLALPNRREAIEVGLEYVIKPKHRGGLTISVFNNSIVDSVGGMLLKGPYGVVNYTALNKDNIPNNTPFISISCHFKENVIQGLNSDQIKMNRNVSIKEGVTTLIDYIFETCHIQAKRLQINN